MLFKLITIGLVIVVLSILEALFDRAIGIDLSSIPKSKMIAHNVLTAMGGAIMAWIFFCP